MAKITKNTNNLGIDSILKAIHLEEAASFELGKFYKITNGDCIGSYEINSRMDFGYSINELGNYFEHISTLDDIVDLESKALLIKQIFKQFKELSEDAEEKKSHEALINETITFLAQDEVYQCDEIELRFICDNMDITMVDKCSCCGKFLMPDDECYSDDFFDIANEAYIVEYNEFIKNKHVEKVDDLSDFANDNKEHTIDMLVENFGFKDEFIEHLKAIHLPYGRFLTPKFKIGDTFNFPFDYGKKIVRIDKSFTEEDEIVYWSDEYDYIAESELEKQKALLINEFDEVTIVKNDILNQIFCEDNDNDIDIVVPTFNELDAADEYQPNWQLTEDYQNYSLPSIIQIVNELTENFFTTLEVLNSHKEKFRKSKKYGLRTYAEYGAPIEVILELQELFNIYGNGVKNPELELLLLQDSRNTQDFSSIEILVQDEIKYDELSSHLKSTLDKEHHDEVDNLLKAIKEAKADKHEVLHVYDC